MKIERIETALVHEWLIVTVTTDTGLTGIGQSSYWGFPDACERVVDSYRDLLIGEDPLRTNHLWLKMYRSAPFRGGVITAAIAAIDIALWDLRGKHFEAPAHVLLGGPVRDRVRLHAVLATGWLEERSTVDEVVREASEAVAEGFTAIKFDPFPDGAKGFQTDSYARMMKGAVECVAAVREAVGWDVDIAIEGHRKLGPGEAVDFGRELEPFRIFMYEDALPPDSLASWREFTDKVTIPVGTGERNDTIWEFRELLEDGTAQFVRPDVGMAGGLTACMKIAAMAEAYHAQLICHNYVSPLVTAATVQLYAAVTNVGTFEYTLLDEREPRTRLLRRGLVREGGFLLVPDGPGLGVELADGWREQLGEFSRWRPHPLARRTDGSIYSR
ncbi:MAG TPA: mandelate racemase/muconate lactonizing enzyme family protein [Solirubrobacterales bacterium]|nr:mandelate racemase/muconate lactonizing enzyme family protein [Solirubrobacterales bacterium]